MSPFAPGFGFCSKSTAKIKSRIFDWSTEIRFDEQLRATRENAPIRNKDLDGCRKNAIVRVTAGAPKPLQMHQAHSAGCIGGVSAFRARFLARVASIRDEALSGARKNAMFRVPAESPRPLQMCRARSAMNVDGVRTFRARFFARFATKLCSHDFSRRCPE
jgi:hypothetical protein